MDRTTSGGFRTKDGTIHISKPIRSTSSKKLKAMITFAPRQSHFDINNEKSGMNEFRGFFSLFWISIFLFILRTYVRSIETNGHALNLRFAQLISKDAITLALSDAVLVASTALCVPFAKAVSRGWIKYYWTGVVIQHVGQTLILFIAITWTFNRQWPWVQSGFLTLHTLVMIMKMHSYMAVNGYLQDVTTQSQLVLDDLRQAAELEGGWEKAISDSKERRAEADAATGMSDTTSSTPAGTPPLLQAALIDANAASALRNRLNAISNNKLPTESRDSLAFDDTRIPTPLHPHPLIDHPSEHISNLAKEFSELQGELISSGPEQIVWPNNITLKNFVVYQLIPTLVYELEYPRTQSIRPLYVFEKTVATFGTFALLYTVTESFILPLTPTSDQSFLRSLLDLALPFMIAYLLLFYIIFECICNGFAELSYFADRQFYEDWWNSTSWDEFSRKWNKPVHSFLARHVYASTMSSYKLSRSSAMFLTFLLSACVHELVMVVVTHKFRLYLFMLQLIQIPLIAISRIPAIKRNKLMGNIVFWLGLYAGFPLLCVAYCAY
ncbi:MBOAT, membrane-bound O-acyltransferase family-domain-containing protein [Mycena floridula]|nr:MBOAT, membrane-bound O-acyltransferase family-domain-containing protein [Mycena floridula]